MAAEIPAPVSIRSKKVPTLYEADESKYVGPHRWQVQWWARAARRVMERRAYTRWVEDACEEVRVNGVEHLEAIDGPCVIIANHTSHLDTLLVHHALPRRLRRKLYFGAAQDRWFVKGKKKLVLKPWYQSLVLGNFPILRGGGKRALSYAHWLLEQGQVVFLFPEGTRATKDELGEFKLGATLLALANDVPVVPVYLSGLRSIRPKGSRDVRRGVAGVDILAPVRFPAGTDAAAATAELREQLCAVHRRYATGPAVPNAA
ncbi:MAG: lysophospholipid acyltransferase family protein [Pseudomonadales bacterium]|jgi:1-acyl-sn-glycerol-3-phosphate acyltransferase